MNQKKTETQIGGGAVNSAGVVYVKILMKLSGTGRRMGEQSDRGGGMQVVVLHSSPEPGTVLSFPPSSGRLLLMQISFHLVEPDWVAAVACCYFLVTFWLVCVFIQFVTTQSHPAVVDCG